MKRIEAIIRPHRLEAVKIALSEMGVTGLSVTDVRGSESRSSLRSRFAGSDYVLDLPLRIKIEVVVMDEDLDEVVDTIEQCAHSGEPGDGMIFVLPVGETIRIRTQERGDDALV